MKGRGGSTRFVVVVVVVVLVLLFRGNDADPVEDKQALLEFVNKLPHSRSLNWDDSSPVCDHWTGITCSNDKSRVVAVRLPGVGFDGPIPPNTITRLSGLQILSLRSNNINGDFPSDLTNLRNLSYLYLQSNNFSGALPPDFSPWQNLTVVNLSNNRFNGSIPVSLRNLTRLAGLFLANNSLSGRIPDFARRSLQQLDLSNNDLSGPVPDSLRRFPGSAFRGNNRLSFPSGFPSSPAASPSPPEESYPQQPRGGRLGEAALLGIIVAGAVLGAVAFAFLAIVCFSRRKRTRDDGEAAPGVVSGKRVRKKGGVEMSPEKAMARSQDASNRLAFFEGCSYAFDLEDLLRASAEVLGKGTFGTAYKAVMEDSAAVVVKRLRDVGVGKREFEQQMEVVGGIRHENVVELRAYYYSKEEKLMLYDYYPQGSVSAILHGKRGEERMPLDWDTRLKIATGAARGIAQIHTENNGRLVHGNVKASNIFLNAKQFGCVSDAGLAGIMSALAPPISRAAGYRAPEVTDTRKAGQPSDVYSFGVVLLELLTGKSPIHTTAGDEMVHLVRWVHSVVREEWTDEVFDIELMRYANIEEEMVEMLQIAMSCVVRSPDQRPKMADVTKMIENVRRPDARARRGTAPPGSSKPRPGPGPGPGPGSE